MTRGTQDTTGPRVLTWAIFRFILGVAQMTGAVISLLLLARTGLNAWSLGAAVVTCILTGLSVILFGSRSDWRRQRHDGT